MCTYPSGWGKNYHSVCRESASAGVRWAARSCLHDHQAVAVEGVPAIHVEEALWVCTDVLEAG